MIRSPAAHKSGRASCVVEGLKTNASFVVITGEAKWGNVTEESGDRHVSCQESAQQWAEGPRLD
jgi:hypothetical protein